MDVILEKLEQTKARIRVKVEHPFRVIKRQFGHVKVRYRRLLKNTAQLHTLFALSNLCMVRRTLLQQMQGLVRLQAARESSIESKSAFKPTLWAVNRRHPKSNASTRASAGVVQTFLKPSKLPGRFGLSSAPLPVGTVDEDPEVICLFVRQGFCFG